MVIDYNKMEKTIIPNFKGGDKHIIAQMEFDGKNRILKGILEPGCSIGFHKHETSSEVIFVLSGSGISLIDNEEAFIGANMCQYCPKGHSHGLKNTGKENLEFFAVVPEQ